MILNLKCKFAIDFLLSLLTPFVSYVIVGLWRLNDRFYQAQNFLLNKYVFLFQNCNTHVFNIVDWFWGCCGLYVRNFEFLTRILSIIGLLFIGVQAALTFFGEECKEAVHEYTVNRLIYQDTGAMYRASIVLVFVNLGFWGATHCLLPLLKLFMDSEAFLYEPYNREKSTAYYVCCGVCGP